MIEKELTTMIEKYLDDMIEISYLGLKTIDLDHQEIRYTFSVCYDQNAKKYQIKSIKAKSIPKGK
jgi:hypothetical protein